MVAKIKEIIFSNCNNKLFDLCYRSIVGSVLCCWIIGLGKFDWFRSPFSYPQQTAFNVP